MDSSSPLVSRHCCRDGVAWNGMEEVQSGDDSLEISHATRPDCLAAHGSAGVVGQAGTRLPLPNFTSPHPPDRHKHIAAFHLRFLATPQYRPYTLQRRYTFNTNSNFAKANQVRARSRLRNNGITVHFVPLDSGEQYHRTTAAMTTALPKRIIKETERLQNEPVPGISAQPHDDNARYFDVIVEGPGGSCYEGTLISGARYGQD